MRSITESLAISARDKKAVPCPFSASKKHSAKCVCRGAGNVQACEKCAGSGWDGAKGCICQKCGGCGAH